MSAPPHAPSDGDISRVLPRWLAGPWAALRLLGRGIHIVLIVAAAGAISAAMVPVLRASATPEPPQLPATMEEVDWHNPQSSIYCLACHKQVSPAMAGRDVAQGHPQNVPLSVVQQQAIAAMGTVVGPGNTLICMSCHKLGQGADRHMLADTLENSALCQRCHPGHYAQGTPHDLRKSGPNEQNRLGQTVAEGGPCSACHLSHRYARDFVSTPLDPDGRCVTCHQPYRLAANHARTHMEHPNSRCLECHNPHDTQHGEFLRDNASALCLRCHEKLAGGVATGMHPLGHMKNPIPQELIDAGAMIGPDRNELTCTVCHSTHHAENAPLLVLSRNANRLCLACHAEKAEQHASAGVFPKHALQPVMNESQKAVVASWNGRIGAGDELLCVSCHHVHGAEPNAHLLAFKPKYGETCIACHPNEASVFGTSHDLLTNFPAEKNTAGMTPRDAGTCSACHLAHGYPRERVVREGDPAGQCLCCHSPGKLGEKKLVGGIDHPKTRCTECHNAHAREHGAYLAKPEAELCGGCHADQMRLVGGPHDLAQAKNPDKWNATARKQGGLCLPCHVPHGGERADLFRVARGESVGNHDEVCLACHTDAAWNAAGVGAIHPQKIAPDEKKVPLALVPTDAAGNLRMGCRTCHNPHGGAAPVHLARVKPDEPTHALCLHCHADKDFIRFTGHAPDRLSQLGLDTDSCKPCHAMHADRNGVWGQMLSPRFLSDRCEGVNGCVPCLTCHHAGGPAPVRQVATHPEMVMMNINQPGEPAYLPLFNAAGREDPQGQVVCRTCHVSHGRYDLLKRRAENPNMTADEQHAMRMQVRPFVAPNVCTACHGEEARARFLHFHDAEWRSQATQPASNTGTIR